jgi:hypothetical protein
MALRIPDLFFSCRLLEGKGSMPGKHVAIAKTIRGFPF